MDQVAGFSSNVGISLGLLLRIALTCNCPRLSAGSSSWENPSGGFVEWYKLVPFWSASKHPTDEGPCGGEELMARSVVPGELIWSSGDGILSRSSPNSKSISCLLQFLSWLALSAIPNHYCFSPKCLAIKYDMHFSCVRGTDQKHITQWEWIAEISEKTQAQTHSLIGSQASPAVFLSYVHVPRLFCITCTVRGASLRSLRSGRVRGN